VTQRPYHQNSDQREREAVMRNDRANTFAGRASAEADEIQGRWAQEHKATVIGTGPVEYPRLPENSWTNDPTGVEPPLNYSVEAHEPVGEYREVQASIEELGDGEAVARSSPLAAAVAPLEVPCFSPDVKRAAAIPHPKPKPTETR
jgi:hypothetical protein